MAYLRGVEETRRRDGLTSYRIKYRDADGRQVEETLGTDEDGWTRTRAENERQSTFAATAGADLLASPSPSSRGASSGITCRPEGSSARRSSRGARTCIGT